MEYVRKFLDNLQRVIYAKNLLFFNKQLNK